MKKIYFIHSFAVVALLLVSTPARGYHRDFARVLDKYVYGAGSSYCYDQLDRSTYNSGFSSTDFTSNSGIDIIGGKLVLNTDQRALEDTNRITINTKQDLTVHYVYESADQSQTLAWFVWD
ncbi:hypothetical protein KKF84_16740, partial [Myxococcota bacterium]|nr:hypothetical protein [Myxococcota bacterium]